MNIRTLRSSRAFTLIELLIVITIIGILAVALLPRITAGPSKARDAQRKADLQQIATALALYADDNSSSFPWEGAAVTNGCVSDYADDIAPYMTSVPNDPSEEASASCASGGYGFYATSNGYALISALENNTASGVGIYLTSGVLVSSSDSTSDNVSDLEAQLCGTADCTAASATASYVLFR